MSHAPTPDHDCAAGCPLAHATAGLSHAATAGVDRRTFLSQAVLASAYAAAAAALAACGGGGDPTSPTSISSSVSLTNHTALDTVGGVQTLTLNGKQIAIVRTGTSSFIALSLICPHQGPTVDVVSGGFRCPNHGATFNSTGTWIGGQSTGNMHLYPTTYDAATDTLQIG